MSAPDSVVVKFISLVFFCDTQIPSICFSFYLSIALLFSAPLPLHLPPSSFLALSSSACSLFSCVSVSDMGVSCQCVWCWLAATNRQNDAPSQRQLASKTQWHGMVIGVDPVASPNRALFRTAGRDEVPSTWRAWAGVTSEAQKSAGQ